MVSGVLQGSAIGPLLFLMYIKNLGDNPSSPLRLFADDTVIYRLVKSSEDQNHSKNDFDTIPNGAKSGNCLSMRKSVRPSTCVQIETR